MSASPAAAAEVLVNGQPPAHGVSPFDRGLHFGDGLFETIVCRNRKARLLSLHLERLARGCERLRISPPELSVLRAEIEAMAAAAESALLKVIVTRGVAVARGYGISGTEEATRLIFRYPMPAESTAAGREGVQVRVAQLRLGENPVLAGLKHLNRLEQVLARAEAPPEEAAELLLFSSSGHLACGTMSNVFLVQQGRLRTPRLHLFGVAGVMRGVVLQQAEKAGVAAEECVLTQADLDDASELFLTNARIGIWPVSRVNSRALEVGSITRRLQAALAPLLESSSDA